MKTQDILDHLEKLNAVALIAKHGSIRTAAAELKISQPSLSVKISTLENILGFQIFERSRYGVQVTAPGEKLVAFALEIAEKAASVRNEIDSIEPMAGNINIGIYDSIARYFWPSFFRYISKKYPRLTITLHTGRTSTIENLLISGNLDIGIVVEPRVDAKIQQKMLFFDDMSLFATPEFIKNSMKLTPSEAVKISDSSAQQLSLIIFSQALIGMGRSIENNFPDLFSKRFIIHNVENFEIALAFCLEGLGIAILPNRVAENDLEADRLVKLGNKPNDKLNFFKHRIKICSQKTSTHHANIQIFKEEICNFII